MQIGFIDCGRIKASRLYKKSDKSDKNKSRKSCNIYKQTNINSGRKINTKLKIGKVGIAKRKSGKCPTFFLAILKYFL